MANRRQEQSGELMRFLFNLLKILLVIILLVLVGIAIYTLFFDPNIVVEETTKTLELTQ